MSPVLTLGDGQNAGGDPSFTPRGRPSPGLSGWPNPQRTKITRIRRKHTNLDPCILPDSPSRSHNAMGRLWNRLLSHSVAPMLIVDIGGITTAPPKSPYVRAPQTAPHPLQYGHRILTDSYSRSPARDQARGCLSANVTRRGTTRQVKNGVLKTPVWALCARVQRNCGPQPGPNASTHA